MNWKKVVSVLLVSAMTLSMAACGDTASTSDNAAAGTETKGSTANASSDEKLVVWTLSNDLIDFGKRFQEQTGVEVDTVVISQLITQQKFRQHYLQEKKNRISSLVSQRC